MTAALASYVPILRPKPKLSENPFKQIMDVVPLFHNKSERIEYYQSRYIHDSHGRIKTMKRRRGINDNTSFSTVN